LKLAMTESCPRILLIEDDPDAAALLHETIIDHFQADRCTLAGSLAAARRAELAEVDLVICDINLPDGSGLDLLVEMLAQRSDLPVVIVTSESGLDVAMEAIRRGAYDYVVKVGDYLFTVPLVVEKNLEVWRTKQDNRRLQHELEQMLNELQYKNAELEEAVAKLEQLACTDPLTGLANRRHFQDALDQKFAESQRKGRDLACAMIDLDHFKALNDNLGHQRGDRLLRTTARVLEANCRSSDIAGRYGGDEFVLLMPDTDPDTAVQIIQRVRRRFREDTQAITTDEYRCEMSIGIATVSLNRPAHGDQLIAIADAALYQAKGEGRGRIILAEPPVKPTPA
jgi:diguanylate cyclase (GGDEF)-like protein